MLLNILEPQAHQPERISETSDRVGKDSLVQYIMAILGLKGDIIISTLNPKAPNRLQTGTRHAGLDHFR